MKKRLLTLCAAAVVSLTVAAHLQSSNKEPANDIAKAGEKDTEPVKKIDLLFPVNGETVDILKPKVVQFISAMKEQAKAIKDDQILHDFYVMAPDTTSRHYGETFTNETDLVRVADYATTSTYMQSSKKVMLTFAAEGYNPTAVKVSANPDMSDAVIYSDLLSSDLAYYVGIQQLYSNKTYYWQVFEGEEPISEVASFKTAEGFRMIKTNSVTNVRDMGGRRVAIKTGVDEELNNVYEYKHIKQGLIFRGGELVEETYTPTDSSSSHTATLQTGDAELFVKDLQIGLEIDLRGDAESGDLTESPLKSYYKNKYSEEVDVNYLRLANLSAYDNYFSISSSKPYYNDIKNMFKAFANAEERHVYFHCWGGADRTGTVGFLLGGLLGMSLTDLIIDYELTSFSCNYRPHDSNDAKKVYRFPSLLRKLVELKVKGGEETYWQENKPISQIIEEILIDRFQVTAEDIANIRNNLLED